MRIGICTIVDYNNYGNRLQNYALQEILKERGHEVVTIKNNYSVKKNVKQKIKNNLTPKKIVKNLNNKFKKIRHREINSLRNKNFKSFSDTYINETDHIFDKHSEEFKHYDCYVIGSDQVWNYNFKRFSSFDFASFTTNPKFSYAASFGVETIEDDFIDVFQKGLNNLTYISVRESAGKAIVEQLTDKRAEVVLDPTLLLEKEKWLDLVSGKDNYEQPFILTYFIDKPLRKNKIHIENHALQDGLEIKNLSNVNFKDLWISDPLKFVDLFSQAEYIYTDSFHACVFSIIFEKNFEVFNRNTDSPSMNSRIETLLKDFDLLDRWINDNQLSKVKDNINYTKVNILLNKRRKESNLFLDNCLNAIDKSC